MRAFTLNRAPSDNALLRVADRTAHVRRALAAAFWMLSYGASLGAVLYVAYLIGQARLQ